MAVISGTPVAATLRLSAEASGVALLLIGHASEDGAARVDQAAVAPGATASVTITPVGFGIMRVHVNMADEDDEGTLTVDPPGPQDESIRGDTSRGYVVVDP